MLAALATAAALGTVGVEGTELVYRSSPGRADRLTVTAVDGQAEFFAPAPTAAAGCTPARRAVRCSLANITAIRILTADGDDKIDAEDATVPLIVDLGPGRDAFSGTTPSLTLLGGEGDDEAFFAAPASAIDMGPGDDLADGMAYNLTGPWRLVGGEGDDDLSLFGQSAPGTAFDGGPGDDRLSVQADGTGVDIACGPGGDRVDAMPEDRPGDGCAPYLAGITPRAVSRDFREGALTASATGSVTLKAAIARDSDRLARGTFDAAAGPLRVRLKPTEIGRRLFRRVVRPRVSVVVRTRAGNDHHEVTFDARLAR